MGKHNVSMEKPVHDILANLLVGEWYLNPVFMCTVTHA